SGKITSGETVVYGYYTQGDLEFNLTDRVIDVIKEIAEVVTVGTGETISASAFLTHFKFDPKVQYGMVEKLSGGEKRRLQLMKVLIQNPNFLILDEPTNDLDIQTLNILEDFLMAFGGCIILVSHDRYFMDKLVEHLFVFEGDGVIRDFPGNYTDYREWVDSPEAAADNRQVAEESKKSGGNNLSTTVEKPQIIKKKLSFKEQKEYDDLGKAIEQLEAKKEALTEQLNGGGSYEDLANWAKEIEKLTNELDEKELRWLEISENM
ncbi:MAG: ABC-F family ATP-binding cassette domain-containing protein, partial [Arcicella sp.]|nr:ABC-F family ATP-binding cassette domain-containing protein [Arcicella sp.]